MPEPRIEQLEGEAAMAARQPILRAIDEFNDGATGRPEPARRLAITIRADEGGEILEKLGYALFGEVAEYPPGHRRFWLSKRLDARVAGQP